MLTVRAGCGSDWKAEIVCLKYCKKNAKMISSVLGDEMRIRVRNAGKRVPDSLIKACDGNRILAKVFLNRGISTVEQLNSFLDYETYKPYYPLDFPKMKEACELLIEAIDNKEKIAVYGDYDADGVTATTVLVSGLRRFGADVVYHVPDRFSEGYGMNVDVIKRLKEENVSVIVTCDCGIANFDEIKLAKELGMKVILTDHHTIGESIPDADFVINPKLLEDGHPIRMVSGCGVAYYLIKSLGILLNQDIADEYLDLVALSIISDVIPLRQESRYLFIKGFPKLANGERTGVRMLLSNLSSGITKADDIGFYVAPQINAVGRMDNAKTAVELFLTDDEVMAKELADTVHRFNIDRKNIQAETYEEAKRQVEEEKKNKKIFILYAPNWHHGIIGIVAGKICEEYGKPCIVLSLNEENDCISGSARSIEKVNIYQLLSKFKDDLIKFGGHSEAAGLSLRPEMLSKFTHDLEKYADLYFALDDEKEITIDCELKFSDVNENLWELLRKGEPYGSDFSEPVFATRDCRITKERISGLHHFLTLTDTDGNEIGTTLWKYGTEPLLNKCCTVVYGIYKDTYQERNEIKIKVSDLSFDPVEIIQHKAKFIDRRNIPISDVIKEFPEYKVFYEGPEMYKPFATTVNRNFTEDATGIILSSLPENSNVFDEIVENANCDKIVINYSYLPKYDWNTFLKNFLGVVKMAVMRNAGDISIEKIAKILLIDTAFVRVCLKLYEKYGYFSYKIEENMIHFDIIDKEPRNDSYLESIVERYLAEKQEYASFMNTVPIEE